MILTTRIPGYTKCIPRVTTCSKPGEARRMLMFPVNAMGNLILTGALGNDSMKITFLKK